MFKTHVAKVTGTFLVTAAVMPVIHENINKKYATIVQHAAALCLKISIKIFIIFFYLIKLKLILFELYF